LEPVPAEIQPWQQRYPYRKAVKAIHYFTKNTIPCQFPDPENNIKWPVFCLKKVRNPPYGQKGNKKKEFVHYINMNIFSRLIAFNSSKIYFYGDIPFIALTLFFYIKGGNTVLSPKIYL